MNISQINLGIESQNFRLESQNLGTFPKNSEKLITFPSPWACHAPRPHRRRQVLPGAAVAVAGAAVWWRAYSAAVPHILRRPSAGTGAGRPADTRAAAGLDSMPRRSGSTPATPPRRPAGRPPFGAKRSAAPLPAGPGPAASSPSLAAAATALSGWSVDSPAIGASGSARGVSPSPFPQARPASR